VGSWALVLLKALMASLCKHSKMFLQLSRISRIAKLLIIQSLLQKCPSLLKVTFFFDFLTTKHHLK